MKKKIKAPRANLKEKRNKLHPCIGSGNLLEVSKVKGIKFEKPPEARHGKVEKYALNIRTFKGDRLYTPEEQRKLDAIAEKELERELAAIAKQRSMTPVKLKKPREVKPKNNVSPIRKVQPIKTEFTLPPGRGLQKYGYL